MGSLRSGCLGSGRRTRPGEPLRGEFVEAGLRRGTGASVAFCHSQQDLACVVHGDDFTFCGPDEGLDWTHAEMQKWFEIRVRGGLEPDEGDDAEASVIGRVVRWRSWGIEHAADPRHMKKVMKYFGFSAESKGFSSTGRIEEAEEDELVVEAMRRLSGR